jgi:hypothetical protein
MAFQFQRRHMDVKTTGQEDKAGPDAAACLKAEIVKEDDCVQNTSSTIGLTQE